MSLNVLNSLIYSGGATCDQKGDISDPRGQLLREL